MRASIIVAFAFLVVAAPAHAASNNPFCYGEVETTVKVQAFLKAHAGSKLAIMEGDKAVAWMEAFNTLPPLSEFVADKIWTVENLSEDSKYFRLGFFLHNDLCFNMRIPIAVYVAITEHAKRNNH